MWLYQEILDPSCLGRLSRLSKSNIVRKAAVIAWRLLDNERAKGVSVSAEAIKMVEERESWYQGKPLGNTPICLSPSDMPIGQQAGR